MHFASMPAHVLVIAAAAVTRADARWMEGMDALPEGGYVMQRAPFVEEGVLCNTTHKT